MEVKDTQHSIPTSSDRPLLNLGTSPINVGDHQCTWDESNGTLTIQDGAGIWWLSMGGWY